MGRGRVARGVVRTRCRKLGAKTALAYVDKHPNLMQEGGIQNYSRSGFDHVVVPNTLMSQHHTQALGGSRVWVIPQQNPNVNRVIKTNTADPVHVVAWQGSPENRMSAEVRVRADTIPHRTRASLTRQDTRDA
jgi:hypothetical protein